MVEAEAFELTSFEVEAGVGGGSAPVCNHSVVIASSFQSQPVKRPSIVHPVFAYSGSFLHSQVGLDSISAPGSNQRPPIQSDFPD
jgi:hypothetical protein